MLEAKLLVVGGETKTHEIVLKHWPSLVGRSREAAVKLPHPLVSRNHCEIFAADGKLYVRDLGSLNGTYVGSERVREPLCLEPNGLLTIGTVTFRAIYEPNGSGTEFTSGDAQRSPTARPAGRPGQCEGETAARPLGDLWETQPAPQPTAANGWPAAAAEPAWCDEPAALHDTQPSSLDLDRQALAALDGQRPAAVYSSVAVTDSAVGASGSVSLSALQQLPQPPAALSFSGGIHLAAGGRPGESPAADDGLDSRIRVETSTPGGAPRLGTPAAERHARPR